LTPDGKGRRSFGFRVDSSLDVEYARSRTWRLAALVLFELLHEGRPIPADDAEFESRWPRASREHDPYDKPLTYRRLSSSRFRICRSDRPAQIPAEPRKLDEFGDRFFQQFESGIEVLLPDWMVGR